MVYTGKGSVEDDPPVDSLSGEGQAPLYFFPDQNVPDHRVRWILLNGSREERAWVISHLLRFALWDDIWTYVSRDEVREIFPELELPENLVTAWARILKIELAAV